jgi:signal transduction histidine kinase
VKSKLQLVAVEDSEADLQITARHLAKAGLDCDVYRAQTEPEFASLLGGVKPDLIISDFSLPQFDGLRALEIAVALAPETPFIFVSGTIGEERAIEALRRGATDYVLKTNLSRLSSAVERALREASLKATQRQSDRQRREQQTQLERLARLQALELSTLQFHLNNVSNRLNDLGIANAAACRELAALRLDRLQAELETINHLLRQLHEIVTEAAESLPFAKVPIEGWPGEHELRQRLASLEETVRLRTANLEQANEQIREQVRLREGAEVELGQQQKLQALGQLAAGIAHEINTPIQYISDSVHFLGSAFDDLLAVVAGTGQPQNTNPAPDLPFLRKEVPGAIGRIMEGSERVATIVRAMKEFAYPDAAEKEPADLNRAIETMLLIARSEYKYVATAQLHAGDIPQVICNVGELSQVFLNLIVNAAHALADDGRNAESGRINIRTTLVGDWVELQFEDNGCGIPKQIIDKIYDPFFTTKKAGRGTGQGLAIARSIIVDKHSGRIDVESTPGVGTLFTLRLPIGGPAADP